MAVELADRLSWWLFIDFMHVCFLARTSCSNTSARMKALPRRSTSVPFRRFLGDVQRMFMQRLYLVLAPAGGVAAVAP
jgi:hypothetical protein